MDSYPVIWELPTTKDLRVLGENVLGYALPRYYAIVYDPCFFCWDQNSVE